MRHSLRTGSDTDDDYAPPVNANQRELTIAQRAHRRQARREAFLRSRLEAGERVIAHQGAVMVTDHRIVFAWERHVGGSGWHSDAVAFDEIIRWSLGRRHDQRPLLRLQHPTHARSERVAAHRVLWFSWGNAEAEVPHDDITLAFGSDRDQAFQATLDRLKQMNLPRGEDFIVALAGTREERTRGSRALYRRL